MRRISRGTPYVLTSVEIENLLGALTPRVEESVAALVGMPVDDWRKQSKSKRAAQLVDYQNRGLLAATLSASAKAHTDLESAAFVVTQVSEAQTLAEEVAALRAIVADLVAGHSPKKTRR